MAIDPNIIMGIKPVQVESPVNALAQVLGIQQAQQQNKLAQLLMGEKEREANDSRAMNDLYKTATAPDGTVDRSKLLTGAAERGLGSRIPGLQKGFAETDKASREAEKERIAMVRDRMALIGQVAGAAKDQSSYSAGLQALQGAGVDISNIPAEYSPQYVEQARTQALTVAQQMEQVWKQKGFDLDVQKFGEQKRHHRATEQNAAGQLAVAQSRESREATAPRGQVVQTDQGPMLVDPRTGVGKDITGPDGKAVTKTKPLPSSVVKQVQEVRDNAVTLGRLNSSFKDDYAGKGVFGVGADMQLSAAGTLGKDQDSVAWWKDYRKSAELVERHALFGAALTPTEQASWRNADIGPGMNAETIKRNLATRAALAEKVRNTTRDDMIDAGHNADRVRAIAGREAQQETPAAVKPYADAEKERRYQEWKRSQGK